LKRGIEALILLAKPVYFLSDWLSSLRSVVSFLINWSAAELTNSSERGLAFVTEEQRDELTNSDERESAFVTEEQRDELTNSDERESAFVTKKERQHIL
jgi:hypothetical protein